jgi:hydroxyacylglutathione hydrolase
MLLRYFYDTELAQASYLLGCSATGEALVIDPARHITPYLRMAVQENLQIHHIVETHIHADFVSGSRELAAHTGAKIYLSKMGDATWQYDYAGEPNIILLADGDSWMVGNIHVQAIHTPGHTPEHIVLSITDTLATNGIGTEQPMGIFTGDFLFVGDVGRPDLLEEIGGNQETQAEVTESGARQQFHNIQHFKQLPDYLQIWPGHGAGSACGKALGAVPSTTLGYEKLFNPAFHFEQEDEFVRWLLADQPEAPRYFAQMKKVNKAGPPLLADLSTPTRINRTIIDAALAKGSLVIDLRPAADYRQAYVPGTISIPSTAGNFSTYVGYFVDYNSPPYLVLSDVAELGEILRSLRAIGVDHIAGYAGPDVVMGITENLPVISSQELAARQANLDATILDVRSPSEYEEEHIVGARNVPLSSLARHLDQLDQLDELDQLPHDQKLIIHCASGYRSQIASSFLRAKGFENVVNLHASKDDWSKALETTTSD